MRKLTWTILLTFLMSIGIYAQNSGEELKQLRKQVNLPNSVQILLDKNEDFPKKQTIKIYLAIKHNKSFAKDFVKWVDKWNKENAADNGTLEIVEDISDADIAAAQFMYGLSKFVREDSISISTGRVSKDEELYGVGIGNSKIRANRGYRKLDKPLYSYLLIRNKNGTWDINFSYVDEAFDYSKTFPEARLQGLIESKMKNR